ncbi:hypothetical protein [Tessaracoccus coleopterorum]|uniref:hypothetical protein n=1 Tax=Tessaracoccus coleopterorum TaxID=2714950 RepID=UPI0018D3CE06|nr:hypothetical protein [Tessaracoccus coleopterorum]
MAGKRSREPGELEAQVLRILRGFDGPVGARAVQDLFDEPRPRTRRCSRSSTGSA